MLEEQEHQIVHLQDVAAAAAVLTEPGRFDFLEARTGLRGAMLSEVGVFAVDARPGLAGRLVEQIRGRALLFRHLRHLCGW